MPRDSVISRMAGRSALPSQPRFEPRWQCFGSRFSHLWKRDTHLVWQPVVCNLRLENLQQDVVSRSCNIAGCVYFENLIDSSFGLLSHLRSYVLHATEICPPTFHRWTEMLKEMFDSRVPTAQIHVHELAEDGPSQPGTVRHGDVDVDQAGRILIQQIEHLTDHRRLKPVRDMTFHFLFHANRLLADLRVEFDSTCNVLSRCQLASDDFDQRDDVWWVERMAEHDTRRVGRLCLEIRNRNARRTTRNDDIGANGVRNVFEELEFEI